MEFYAIKNYINVKTATINLLEVISTTNQKY